MKTSLGGILGVLLVATVPAATAQEDGAGVDSARSTVAKWVETQQIISKERNDWQLGKEVLNQRIALVDSEIATLGERIEETSRAIAEADAKRLELSRENDSLKSGSTSLVEAIEPLEEKTRRLLVSLPGPIKERVEPLSRRIPAAGADVDLSLSERFQNVIGILNEVNKFNQDITVTNELRTLGDGTTAEVTAMYVGLGQGYYVTTSGNAAGVGRPTETGWEWTPADHLAPEIAQAVDILKNTKVPAFVPLPVEIR